MCVVSISLIYLLDTGFLKMLHSHRFLFINYSLLTNYIVGEYKSAFKRWRKMKKKNAGNVKPGS